MAIPTLEDTSVLESDPLWYKDAIIYEVHVRSFFDSTGDGAGDFPGLTQKLDYLQDLGVTAVWVLPFYPSPWKDDGYDISDYCAVHPAYGTLRDFQVFLREAHRRGLRVITELVLNHTSDQHRWFQRARRAKPGSGHRDYYVWSDTPNRYKEARIIFQDFESSNWGWDPVARAYFWHRFYAHQPDLNFSNPAVRQALLRVTEFWLQMGVDGFRLDAVPYLCEREDTSCENLPETHEFLKELRRFVDGRFSNRMLLAEANQWPEDAVQFFGQGDECHMAFHFPLMPRLFMAIRMEDRYPIVEILQHAPSMPEACQWALFLRNHDELTLETVTDAERDYMYRAYARDSRAKINLGIRRRLAPLLNNNRRQIELMSSLLFSLPGSPVVYYGDEIGMGDNIYLGDRNGVRTPMQWSADRNAGFSTANPQKLYLPILNDPEYPYESVNVDAQQNNPHSLLWWTKRLIALRKRYKVFGRGSLEFLEPDNRKVLAYLRRHQDECVLVVANLSRYVQYVHIDLSRFRGRVPVELFGSTPFPPIADSPYFLTLGPHAFYWFALEPQQRPVAQTVLGAEPTRSLLRVRDEWHGVFKGRAKTLLESLLIQYLRGTRWFAGKTRVIRTAEFVDNVALRRDSAEARIVLLRLTYTEGDPETYVLCLAFAGGDRAAQIADEVPEAVIAPVQILTRDGEERGLLFDALHDEGFAAAILDAVGRRRQLQGNHGKIIGTTTRTFRMIQDLATGPLEAAALKVEQSNSSVVYRDRSGLNLFVLKLFRRVEPGINPDWEIGRFLGETKTFDNIARVTGVLEYRGNTGSPDESMTLGVVQGYVHHEGEAWRFTLDSIGHYFDRALARGDVHRVLPMPRQDLAEMVGESVPESVADLIGPYLESVRLLGQRTAELHIALAQNVDDASFAPEPFTDSYRKALYHSTMGTLDQSFRLLRRRLRDLPEDLQATGVRLLVLESEARNRLRPVRDRRISGMRTRIHGHYHLGQVLYTGKDFVILDFEGDPDRPLSERRIKRSPLRDVASMVRSLHYASRAALLGQLPGVVVRPEDRAALELAADFWFAWVSSTFLRAYLQAAAAGSFLPKSNEDLQVLLDVYLIDKAMSELMYDLRVRPDWVGIPMRGLLYLLSNP